MSKELMSKTIEFKANKDNIKNSMSTIDYNYPSLNRKDLTDLSNINDKNHQFKKLNTNRDWSLNLYNLDIEGSSPRKFGYFFNKEDYTCKNSDIEKSSPKIFSQNINKKSFNLRNDDIEFSKPQCVKNTTTRHTNPLQPKYIIGTPPNLPMTPPKYIRDAMEINDIRGARPKKIGNDKDIFKEPIKKEIIQDSWPRRPYIRKSKYEFLDYRDVTNKVINHRNTNPLRPIYNWNYVDDTKSFGPIDGNYPAVYSKYLYKKPFNLSNKDIEGSNTGSKNFILKFNGPNYSYNTKDIKGAQSNTVIRGIITKRHTNPVSPKYDYLGHSEIANIENNPYNIGFKSTGHYNKNNINNKINLDIKDNTINNIKPIKNYNSPEKKDEVILNDENNKKIINNNENSNKILEKKIKIVDKKEKADKKDDYKAFITKDGKPDFGNFPVFNDTVVFDETKYKKPDLCFGLSHYQHIVSPNLNQNQIQQKNYQKLKIPFKSLNKRGVEAKNISTFSEDNYYTKLDEFMNSKNIKLNENETKNRIENSVPNPNQLKEKNENNGIEKNAEEI